MYPALAVLQAYINNISMEKTASTTDEVAGKTWEQSVLWIGSKGGMEANLVNRFPVPYKEIPAAGVHGVGWSKLPGNLKRIWDGFIASLAILKEYQPDILFFTGGYLSIPMALAGKYSPGNPKKPKILLYVPDIEPGLALKVVARIADKITVTAEQTKRYLQKNKLVSVVGYPTRQELIAFSNMTNCKAIACKIFDLSVELPTILVFGGSKGARSINRALMGILPELLLEMQVIHICGELDWQENSENSEKIKNELASDLAQRYRIFPYLHEEMAAALACSDIVVSRAGASILGEFPLFGIPAILVPYPYAWQYQYVNAQYLEAKHGAVVIKDTELSEKLLPEIQKLIQNPHALEAMRTAMNKLARPDPAMKIVEIIQNMSTDNVAEV